MIYWKGEVSVPEKYYERIKSLVRTNRSAGSYEIEDVPFNTYVDIWFLSLCIAYNKNLDPPDKLQGHRRITGGIDVLRGDHEKLNLIKIICMHDTNKEYIIGDSLKMMKIANRYAEAGLTQLFFNLDNIDRDPLDNLNAYIKSLLG